MTLNRRNRALGQALVEFRLMFVLFLVFAWIPADFGLAFYSSQLAQNASREGARIAAADRTLVSGTTSVDDILKPMFANFPDRCCLIPVSKGTGNLTGWRTITDWGSFCPDKINPFPVRDVAIRCILET